MKTHFQRTSCDRCSQVGISNKCETCVSPIRHFLQINQQRIRKEKKRDEKKKQKKNAKFSKK